MRESAKRRVRDFPAALDVVGTSVKLARKGPRRKDSRSIVDLSRLSVPDSLGFLPLVKHEEESCEDRSDSDDRDKETQDGSNTSLVERRLIGGEEQGTDDVLWEDREEEERRRRVSLDQIDQRGTERKGSELTPTDDPT